MRPLAHSKVHGAIPEKMRQSTLVRLMSFRKFSGGEAGGGGGGGGVQPKNPLLFSTTTSMFSFL